MAWKAWLEDLRRRLIVDPILLDPRSAPGTRLGKTADWVFRHGIGGGQADFDQPIADLSPRDRAMLYAFFNQKGHINELIHAFELFLPEASLVEGSTVLDIGCGPFTAGLALANVVGSSASYRYVGIDRASSMRELGQDLVNGVCQAGEFHGRTSVSFHADLATVNFGIRRAAERTLVVLSYLLASDSIDPHVLANDITSAVNLIGWGPVCVLYTNSVTAYNRRHFPVFQASMEEVGFQLELHEIAPATALQRSIHYAMFVRDGRRSVPIGEFRQ